jgi:hypothetical protein
LQWQGYLPVLVLKLAVVAAVTVVVDIMVVGDVVVDIVADGAWVQVLDSVSH